MEMRGRCRDRCYTPVVVGRGAWQGKDGWGEDVSGRGISLQLVEMSKNDSLDAEAGGVKGKDQGKSAPVLGCAG